jgi:putative ABC transport system permease protein
VGRSLVLNGEAFGIVGVLEREFIPPVRDVEVFVPLAPDQDPWRRNRASTSFMRGIARVRPGVSREQVQSDLDGIAGQLQQEFPDSYARKKGVLVVPYREEMTRLFSNALLMLQAAVGLLLIIACANLANLTFIRASARRRELAVRQAMGASRGQLVRPLLVESGLVALGGALLGVLLAASAVPPLVALLPAALPRAQEIRISVPVLFFTLGAAALATLLFGLGPALRAARSDPGEELKSEGRGAAGAAGQGRLRGLAVGSQVALMTVLLTGAVLFFESFRAVLRVSPGFDTRVLTVRLSLPRKDYGELGRVSRFYREVESRVAALPGVAAVAAVNHVPLNGALASADYKVAGQAPVADDQLATANYRMVTPAYFRAMGIPLLEGRSFDEGDREGGAAVAIVSQSLARQSFPDGRPLGRELLVNDNPSGFRPVQIVGVVGDVKHAGLEAAAAPHVYVPYHQTPSSLLVFLNQNQFLVVRSSGSPLSLAEPVRRALQAVDGNVATADIRTSGHYADAAAAARRFSLILLAVFAGLAVALASVGIYGVAAFTVTQRRREAGVRIALGAQRRDILALVLGDGLRRALAGLGLGLAGALAASHALRGLLYGVSAVDPLAYAGVGVLVLAVSVLASLGPAWRATRTDPMVALRGD